MSITCEKQYTLTLAAAPTSTAYAYFKCEDATGGWTLTNSVDEFHLSADSAPLLSDPGFISNGVRIGNVPASVARSFSSDLAIPHWDLSANSFTIRFWVKFTFYGSWYVVTQAMTTEQWTLYYENGTVWLELRLPGWPTLTAAISSGTWHRVLFWVERGVGYGLKIDNEAAQTAANTNIIPAANQRLYIGATFISGAHTIDEYAIWTRKLSDAEMLDDWNSGLGRTYPDVP